MKPDVFSLCFERSWCLTVDSLNLQADLLHVEFWVKTCGCDRHAAD